MKTYLSAKEAADRLGVSRHTLYSYVSRGSIRSVGGEDGRSRRYLGEDVDRWRARHDARAGHAAAAGTALRWGAPVMDSAITRIARDPEDGADGSVAGPIHRGYAATTLAQSGRSFEDVAELLWTGTLAETPTRWSDAPLLVDARELVRALRGVRDPIDALTLTTALAHAGDADRALSTLGDPSIEHARARRLIRTLVVAIAVASGRDELARVESAESVSLAIARALGARAPKAAAPWIDRALILAADHELNVSTFAARVTSSSHADLLASVLAALAAFSGPAHGASPRRVEALLDEAIAAKRPRDVLLDRARRGDAIAGFGHPLYPGIDPRAVPMLAFARALEPKPPRVKALLAIVDAMASLGGEAPNVDIGLVALTDGLGLPRGSATILFALGRTAGWVAHALEQRSAGHILRPRARYVGVALIG